MVFEGLVINPGAYAHTSVAIYDALEMISCPKVEAPPDQHECKGRRKITAKACDFVIEGLGKHLYVVSVFSLVLGKDRNEGEK